MNREFGPDPAPLDDAELARLVHEVVDDWTMPPVRLDQPGWRERVRRPGTRRPTLAVGGVLRRLAGAAAIALVLTIGLALLGVWLTLPRSPGIGNPGPTATGTATPTATFAPSGPTSTARPTQAPTATALPGLIVNGDLPSPSKVVVELQEGEFALVDLAKGELARPFALGSYGSAVRRAPNGSLYCICVELSDIIEGGHAHAAVSFQQFDAAGARQSSTKLAEYSGEPDPRDGVVPEQPEHVRALVSYGTDPRYAFVGWSSHSATDWKNGLLVVDVATGAVVQDYTLPNATSGDGDTRQFTDAPRVVGEANGTLIIGRHYYTWSPPGSTTPNLKFGSDAFTAPFADGQIGTSSTLTAADGCGNFIELAGGLPDGGLWIQCSFDFGSKNVRRIAADGTTSLGDTRVTTVLDIEGTTTVPSPDGKALYLWHPVELRLTRIDLATGTTETSEAPKPAASTDWLRALGRWLVPSAEAKMLLRAGIAIAADGKHVYALGVDRSGGPEEAGSAGIYVFDTAGSMAVDRWDATADFISLAVSDDGRYVFAAGMPGVNAAGRRGTQPASITVYDASSGDVRLIAGDLGQQLVTFPQQTLR